MFKDRWTLQAADLIRQTRERSPKQADELFRKTLDGLGAENAIRLRDALDDTADDADGSETMSMGGRVRPLPVSGPATPQDIDKALENAGKDLERLSRDPEFLKTPLGQAILVPGMFKKLIEEQLGVDARTDVAEPLPDREELPAHERDTDDDSNLAGDTPVPKIPDRGELLPDDIDATVPGTTDQSDDPDIGGAQVLEMDAYANSGYDLTNGEEPHKGFKGVIDDNLVGKSADAVHKHVTSDGQLTERGKSQYQIERDRDPKHLKDDYDDLVANLGPGEHRVTEDGYPYYISNEGVRVMPRNSKNGIPTLDVQVPDETARDDLRIYKVRYRPKE